MDLYETSFLCNKVEIKVLGGKYPPPDMKYCSSLKFSIKFVLIGSAAGVDGTVILLEKGNYVHPRLRGTNIVTP